VIEALVEQVAAAIEAETNEYRNMVKRIEKAIKDKQNEIKNLVAAVAQGENVELYNEGIKLRQAEIEELQKQKEQLAVSKPAVEKIDALRLKEYIECLNQVLAHGTNRERREFIRTFIRRMEFDPATNRITIYWYADPVQVHSTEILTHNNVRFLTGVGGACPSQLAPVTGTFTADRSQLFLKYMAPNFFTLQTGGGRNVPGCSKSRG